MNISREMHALRLGLKTTNIMMLKKKLMHVYQYENFQADLQADSQKQVIDQINPSTYGLFQCTFLYVSQLFKEGGSLMKT